MKKQSISDVKKYIMESLRKKYGTYAGDDHCGNIEILNDDDTDRIVISVEQQSDKTKKQLSFEETKQLYDFLRGEGNTRIESLSNVVLPDYNIWTKKAHLPKLTDEQAFLVIYVLQEKYGIIPDTYEQCSCCGELYDSDEEGQCYEEEPYCDTCYSKLDVTDTED